MLVHNFFNLIIKKIQIFTFIKDDKLSVFIFLDLIKYNTFTNLSLTNGYFFTKTLFKSLDKERKCFGGRKKMKKKSFYLIE